MTTLIGHSGEVFATRFDPTGHHIASGSADRSISEEPMFRPAEGREAAKLTDSIHQCYGIHTGHARTMGSSLAIRAPSWTYNGHEILDSFSPPRPIRCWPAGILKRALEFEDTWDTKPLSIPSTSVAEESKRSRARRMMATLAFVITLPSKIAPHLLSQIPSDRTI